MKHKISHSLYSYWNLIRGSRVAPRRFEIEPSRIAAFLSDTFILDCDQICVAGFRLAGTRIANVLGQDVREFGFQDLFAGADRQTITHVLQQVTQQAAAGLITAMPQKAVSPHQRFELLLLPLYHVENSITRVLGSLAPLEPIVPSRTSEVLPLQLIEHTVIWPDGRPRAILQHMNRQSPFAPELRGGRIVTADRRRFRVFDGGRTG